MAKAARQLAMSQPAVSEAIANLEQLLRVRLLDRSTHGVEPTLYARTGDGMIGVILGIVAVIVIRFRLKQH